MVSTDHCPFCMKDQKELGLGDFRKIPNGIGSVEHRMDLMYQGVVTGELTLERWVELTSTTPARMFGLAGRKGAIQPGADADLVVYDPNGRTTIGMPVDADLLRLLVKYREPGTVWQTTLIGREEIWDLHQATADLGGMLRSGVEDTFYLPGGERTSGNGQLIEALARCARNAGREIASPEEARRMLGLKGLEAHGVA